MYIYAGKINFSQFFTKNTIFSDVCPSGKKIKSDFFLFYSRMVSWKVAMPCTSFLGQTVFSISKKICSYEAFPKLCENWCCFQIEIAPGCQSRYVTIAGGKTSFYENTNKWIWNWGICVASNLRWCHTCKLGGVQRKTASSTCGLTRNLICNEKTASSTCGWRLTKVESLEANLIFIIFPLNTSLN